jgi:CubicO group peptidase (beta-lactamase class C family)
MTTDAIFDLASLAKVYTATLLRQLVDAGKVDLAAPVP